jgi:DNA replication protein DnaC
MESISNFFKRMGIEVSNQPMSDDEFRQFTVDCYNESEGDLDKQDGIVCEVCKNKGWIQVIEGGYEPHRKCKCMVRRQAYKNAKQSGLGKYLNKTFKDYRAEETWQMKCIESVEAYLTDHSHDNVWFIACGQSGSGKTLLCSIISNTLLQKKERAVMYIVWTDFISQLKRDVMGDKTNEVSEAMEKVKNADVLFLDEVVKKYNETDLKYLIEIINYRYTNDKKTIITSEKQMNEFLAIDEATFSRAIEQCEGYMINIPKDRKKNYRLKAFNL